MSRQKVNHGKITIIGYYPERGRFPLLSPGSLIDDVRKCSEECQSLPTQLLSAPLVQSVEIPEHDVALDPPDARPRFPGTADDHVFVKDR